jgi:hypothetical protein
MGTLDMCGLGIQTKQLGPSTVSSFLRGVLGIPPIVLLLLLLRSDYLEINRIFVVAIDRQLFLVAFVLKSQIAECRQQSFVRQECSFGGKYLSLLVDSAKRCVVFRQCGSLCLVLWMFCIQAHKNMQVPNFVVRAVGVVFFSVFCVFL